MSRTLGLGLLLLVVASPTHAQLTTSPIVGEVRGPSGAMLPGATVSARHLESGLEREAVSGADGEFTLAALPLGTYEVRAALSGFRPVLQQGIHLEIGSTVVLRLILDVGAAEDEITVVADITGIQTRSGELSFLVTENQVRDLPLNGRNYTDLAFLQPGVIAFPYRDGGSVVAHGLGASINGQDPRSNVYLLDGTLMNDFTNSPAGSAAGTALGTEMVHEFRVETNAYSAEYGRNYGGQINVITKSGSNDLHGSVFEYHRNDGLDAPDYFDTEGKPDFERNQFGFTLGGPIRTDRTFFFVGYEGLRERLGRTVQTVVPNEAARLGILPDPGNPGGTILVPVDPGVRPYLDEYPLPNGGDLGGGLAAYSFPFSQDIDQDYFQLRLDQNLRRSDQLFVRYTYDNAAQFLPTDFPQFPRTFLSKNQFLTAEYRLSVSSNTLATFRFGYSRTRIGQEVEANTSQPLQPFVPGRPSLGDIDVGGIPRFGPQISADVALDQDVFSLQGDLLLSRGRHTVTAGVLAERYHNDEFNPTFSRGLYAFGNLQGFLTNSPLRFIGLTPEGDLERKWRSTLLGAYVQDQVRLGSSLTLNAGLRLEYATLPEEKGGRDINMPDLLAPETTVGPLYDNPGPNLSPRLSFAWDVFGDGRTALRGGYGLYFNNNVQQDLIVTITNPPFTPRPVIPRPDFPQPDFSRGVPLSIRPIQWDIEHPAAARLEPQPAAGPAREDDRDRGLRGVARAEPEAQQRRERPGPGDASRRHRVLPADRVTPERQLLRDRAQEQRRPVLVRRPRRRAAPDVPRRPELPVLVHLLPQHRHHPGLDLLLRLHQRQRVLDAGVRQSPLQPGSGRLRRDAQLGRQLHLGPALRPGIERAHPCPPGRLAARGDRPVPQRAAADGVRPGEPLALALVPVARSGHRSGSPEPRARAHHRGRGPGQSRAVVRSHRLRACSRREPWATPGEGRSAGRTCGRWTWPW